MLWLRLKLNYLKNGSEYQIMHLREIVTIFSTIFLLKDSIWVPYEQAKTVSQTFSFSSKICRYSIAKFENHVSA